MSTTPTTSSAARSPSKTAVKKTIASVALAVAAFGGAAVVANAGSGTNVACYGIGCGQSSNHNQVSVASTED